MRSYCTTMPKRFLKIVPALLIVLMKEYFWAIRAVFAKRNGDRKAFSHACLKVPDISSREIPFDSAESEKSLMELLSNLRDDALVFSPASSSDEDDGLPSPSSSIFNEAFELLKRRSKRIGLTGIVYNGETSADNAQAAEFIISYWSEKFADKPMSCKAADLLTSFSSRFPEVNFHISFVKFCEVLNAKKDSAPGPDEFPSRAWALSPDFVKRSLYECYCHWIKHSDLPCNFNHYFL